MLKSPTRNKEEISIIHKKENESGFMLDAIIDRKAIRRSNFTLSEKHNFDIQRSLREIFSRKNIIYFGKIIGEEPVPIEQTQGNIIIPIINKQQINDSFICEFSEQYYKLDITRQKTALEMFFNKLPESIATELKKLQWRIIG